MKKQTTTIEQLYEKIEKLVSVYPAPLIETVYAKTKSPFLSLVACMLSARTNDKTTLSRLPGLFAVIKAPKDFESISQDKLEKLLYPIGFYRNKAKFLKRFPKVLQQKFNGIIPSTIEELVQLPGVGRKTANLILSVVFEKDAICVDTHVHRIMNCIGYVHTKTPLQTEMALRKKLPKKLWRKTNYLFVLMGQHLCPARGPMPPTCPLKQFRLKDNA